MVDGQAPARRLVAARARCPRGAHGAIYIGMIDDADIEALPGCAAAAIDLRPATALERCAWLAWSQCRRRSDASAPETDRKVALPRDAGLDALVEALLAGGVERGEILAEAIGPAGPAHDVRGELPPPEFEGTCHGRR